MAVRTTEFQLNTSTDTKRTRSNAIWFDCPWDQIENGEVDGIALKDDFTAMPLIPTETTQIAYDKYKVFATANAAFTPVSAVNAVDLGLGIGALTHAANNDAVTLAQAYPPFKVTGVATTSNKLWFECRVAVKSLLTLRNGFFVGLAETNLFTLTTTVPFNADAAIPDNSGAVLGFNKWEIVSTVAAATTSLSGGINTCYNDRATTFTQVAADAAIMTGAFTFIKLGFRYDPNDSKRAVRFFADNVELPTAMTLANITATTNLKANSLGLMISSIAAASVSTDATYIDWWRCAQLNV